MRIVLLTDDFPPKSFGGAGIVAYDDARGFLKSGHTVSVFMTVQNKTEEGESFENEIKIVKVFSKYNERWRGYRSLYNPPVIKKLEKFLKEEKPDVVHAHNIHYHISYYALKLAKRFSKAVFLTAHDTMLFDYGKSFIKDGSYKISFFWQLKEYKFRHNPFRNLFIKRYLSSVNKIFSISNVLKDALISNGIKNVETIYNAIDVSEWQTDQNDVLEFKRKKEIGDFPIIFFNGRLSYAKGFSKLVQAMKLVKEKIPSVRLMIAGTGKSDGGDSIHLGWLNRQEMKYAYALSSVVVFPSVYLDPFGLVNLEAMASYKPVVGTIFGGTPEIVVDGETGYIVNPNNEKELAEKIISLLLDTEKRKKFGEAGFLRARTFFNQENRIQKLIEEYGKVI